MYQKEARERMKDSTKFVLATDLANLTIQYIVFVQRFVIMKKPEKIIIWGFDPLTEGQVLVVSASLWKVRQSQRCPAKTTKMAAAV